MLGRSPAATVLPEEAAGYEAAVVSGRQSNAGIHSVALRTEQVGPRIPLPQPVLASGFQPRTLMPVHLAFNDRWYLVYPRNLGLTFRVARPAQPVPGNAHMQPAPSLRRLAAVRRYSSTTPSFAPTGKGNG